MDTSPIMIVGGGIAGLAAGLALGRHNATIYEQAPAFTAIGAGIQIGPNAVRALQTLGAWDAVLPHLTLPREIHMRDGITGRLLKRLKLDDAFNRRNGAAYHVAHRAGLHAGLLQVLQSRPNLTLKLGHVCEDIEIGADGVRAVFGQHRIQAPALIIADGVQSRLRQKMLPQAQAVHSRFEFHRALLPMPLRSDVPMDCVHLWMFPHGHVVQYAVGQPHQLNVVAITPQSQTVCQVFENACPALNHLLQAAAPHFTIWPGFYVPTLSHWVKDNAMLLGDAAHGTLPYMAQGAAMALEDAACLAQVLPTTYSLRHAFAETTKRRKARTERLHHETLKAGRVYHAMGLLRHLRNAGLSVMPDRLFNAQLDWLYRP